MAFENQLPLPLFPGFTHYGVVSDQVKEIATTFNAESLSALSSVPEEAVRWADVGSRVTEGAGFEVKIPVRLPSSMAFQAFDGTRSYNRVDIAAPAVKPGPFDCNFEWPMVIGQSGIPQLVEFYGASGLTQTVVDAARAFKAQLVASLIHEGFTNSVLGKTAKVLTIPQPGFANGLPLFTDGVASEKHFAHPFKKTSGRFANHFHGVGKITDQNVFGDMLVKMSQVPHPALPNMPLGCKVTDVIGPTHMLVPFYQAAVQHIALQTTTTPANLAAGTTNIFTQQALEQALAAGTFTGASGITPWRFWIAPQLDAHPYVVANPGKHMWLAVSRARPDQCWAELAAPTKAFTPIVTLFGDADPGSRKSKMVSLISDLDAGAAAGLYHFVQMYWETTPV